jgi:hypothetical protein
LEREGVSDLFRAIIPVGKVEAVRLEYEVFRTAGGDYLVFSPSSRGSSSYHMTLVSSAKVEALAAVMGKGRVTTGSLMKEVKLEKTFRTEDRVAMRYDILIGLYILAATGRAEMKKEGRNLVFTRRTLSD